MFIPKGTADSIAAMITLRLEKSIGFASSDVATDVCEMMSDTIKGAQIPGMFEEKSFTVPGGQIMRLSPALTTECDGKTSLMVVGAKAITQYAEWLTDFQGDTNGS